MKQRQEGSALRSWSSRKRTVDALWDHEAWRWSACHPAAIFTYCVVVFLALRLVFGGANYLPSKPWYLLCFIIPFFVVVGLSLGAFHVPLVADAPTALHVILTLVYVQLDVFVASRLVGPGFGTWNVFKLIASKLGLQPLNLDGMSPPGLPPLLRSGFEFNGAFFHETFWNVYICQNCMHRGVHDVFAVLAVPAASGFVHGITTNVNTGLRCLPNFVWVALAYHASGSVLPPALIHALWYFLDAKLCFALKTLKRDWDVEARAGEESTPGWDFTCTVGLLLILAWYVPLNALAHLYPSLKSEGHLDAVVGPGPVEFPVRVLDRGLIVAGLLQIAIGTVTWGVVRAGMRVLAATGDLSEAGTREVAAAVEAYAAQHCLWRHFLGDASGEATSGTEDDSTGGEEGTCLARARS